MKEKEENYAREISGGGVSGTTHHKPPTGLRVV
jgi:hypothetical protein